MKNTNTKNEYTVNNTLIDSELSSLDLFREKLSQIDKQITKSEFNIRTSETMSVSQIQRAIECDSYISNLEQNLGVKLKQESIDMIRNNNFDFRINSSIENSESHLELLIKRAVIQVAHLFDEEESVSRNRLDGLKVFLGEEDFKAVLNILKDTDSLFDRRGKLLHATNSFGLMNIQDLGVISGGLWQKGPSFTDGDSQIALTFNLLWEDLKTKGGITQNSNNKKINGNNYGNNYAKRDQFVDFLIDIKKSRSKDLEKFIKEAEDLRLLAQRGYKECWDIYIKEEKFDKGFKDKIYGELIPSWKEEGKSEDEINKLINDFTKRSLIFKKIAINRPSEDDINSMYGVTLVIDKSKVEVNKDELNGQEDFEVRGIGETSFGNIDTIFVPLNNVEQVKKLINNRDISIKTSEELEIIRLLENQNIYL